MAHATVFAKSFHPHHADLLKFWREEVDGEEQYVLRPVVDYFPEYGSHVDAVVHTIEIPGKTEFLIVEVGGSTEFRIRTLKWLIDQVLRLRTIPTAVDYYYHLIEKSSFEFSNPHHQRTLAVADDASAHAMFRKYDALARALAEMRQSLNIHPATIGVKPDKLPSIVRKGNLIIFSYYPCLARGRLS